MKWQKSLKLISLISFPNACRFHYELRQDILPKNKQCDVLRPPLAIHSEICDKFSPSALVGGVRGRVSELAGGAIISKVKPPPASAKALAPPPKAEGEIMGIPLIIQGAQSVIQRHRHHLGNTFFFLRHANQSIHRLDGCLVVRHHQTLKTLRQITQQ